MGRMFDGTATYTSFGYLFSDPAIEFLLALLLTEKDLLVDERKSHRHELACYVPDLMNVISGFL